jgi:hypothetical protein
MNQATAKQIAEASYQNMASASIIASQEQKAVEPERLKTVKYETHSYHL